MTRIALLLAVLSLPVQAATKGPPCTGTEDLLAIRGSWTTHGDVPGSEGSGRSRNATNQVAARIDKLAQLFRAAYPEPRGIEAIWYRSLSATPLVASGPWAYSLNSLYKAWYCNQHLHQQLLGDETGTWAYAFVNHLGWFADSPKDFQVGGRPVLVLTRRSGDFKGLPAYGGIHNQSSNTGRRFSRTILVTRPGRSPLAPVTRKQFLEAYLAWAEGQAATFRSGMEKSTLDPARKADALRRVDEMQAKQQAPARAKLSAMAPGEAAEPAIVGSEGVFGFKEFSTEERGGRAVVQVDPAYLDRKLAPHVPQFVVVYWTWEKDVPSEAYREEFERRFDPSAVAALLDH
jgi:hypothetical protein